jgi:hypothetical protein
MSTRGIIGFVVEGDEKIDEVPSDAYPSGVGLDTLRWLRLQDPTTLRRAARRVRVVEFDARPTPADIAILDSRVLARLRDWNVDPSTETWWMDVLAPLAGYPAWALVAGVIVDASERALDSLYTEWGYVIDLDREIFEAYVGFQRQPHSRGRFAQRPVPPTAAKGFWPLALVAEWPLMQLPADDEFCQMLEPRRS